MSQSARASKAVPPRSSALGRVLGSAAALLLAAPALLLAALPPLGHGSDLDNGKFERPREPAPLQQHIPPAGRA